MGKGLADIETKRLIASTVEESAPRVPKDFWCGNATKFYADCCFWHYIFYPHTGPERDDLYHPVYEYEEDILNTLKETRQLCVYKATGLGITELMLLWVLWKIYTDSFFLGKEVIMITGPNVDLAQDLIKRTKDFLITKGLEYIDGGAYELGINTARIKCYPSNNIHSARGKPKVSCFFGDEAAFFKLRDDSVVRTVGERYIGKNNAYVVWVSTAGEEPAGFFFDILQEENSIYTKLHMYYDVGLEKHSQTQTSIYTHSFIEKAKEARSFEREFMGIWGSNVGDIFGQEILDEITRHEYAIQPEDQSYDRIIGVDPGFGSSEFGIVITEKSGGKYTVIHAESISRASYIETLDKIKSLSERFHTRRIFADGSWPEGIRDLRDNYRLDVTGISFLEYGKRMTAFAAEKSDKLEVRIHPMFRKLKHQLMTIKYNKKGMPDKTKQNPFDLGDAFLLALWWYKMGSGVIYGIG